MFPSELINMLIIHRHIESRNQEHIEAQTVSLDYKVEYWR